jgi:hypothetical protein
MAHRWFAAIAAFAPIVSLVSFPSWADSPERHAGRVVSDSAINSQRSELRKAAIDGNFGPQSPRDITNPNGTNHIVFNAAPGRSRMNLCNIHIHSAAEHRGGEFTSYVGNGDGSGHGSGFQYNGRLTAAELKPVHETIGSTEHGALEPGDTIEVHFVYSTAHVKPGPTLAACLSKENGNPQLRVEAVVAVLANNRNAADFRTMAQLSVVNGYHAAPNIPDDLGKPVSYAGSTTGPSYNLKPSPLQVTWNVRPNVAKIDLLSLADWLRSNPFKEDHAHGVRNLIIDPALLSEIKTVK